MHVSLFIANFFCGWKDKWKHQQRQVENQVTKVEVMVIGNEELEL